MCHELASRIPEKAPVYLFSKVLVVKVSTYKVLKIGFKFHSVALNELFLLNRRTYTLKLTIICLYFFFPRTYELTISGVDTPLIVNRVI